MCRINQRFPKPCSGKRSHVTPPWTYINVTHPWTYINVTPVKAHIHHSRENAHPSPLRKRTSITPAKLHQRHPGESASASPRRNCISVTPAKAHQHQPGESAPASAWRKRTSVISAKARIHHPCKNALPSPPRKRGAITPQFFWVPAWLHHVTPAKAGGRYCVLLLGSRLAPPRHPREGGGPVLRTFAGFPPGSTTSPPRRRGAGTVYFCWVPGWLHHVTPAKAGGRYCVLLLGSRFRGNDGEGGNDIPRRQ